MNNLTIPTGYQSALSLRETERAIKIVKDTFENKLSEALNLERVTAPLIVTKESGINDDLNGVERKVHFTIKEIDGEAEVVQSLAKWKRMALARYGFEAGEGLYTDMNAVRRDDDVDNLHSIFVDQWDWEKVITAEQRNLDFLKQTVTKIVKAIVHTHETVKKQYSQLKFVTTDEVFFITTQELEDMYPTLTPKEREIEIVKKHRTVFIMQIGALLKSGIKHDGRAPDYDDWQINGDIIFWSDTLNQPIEISSMGVRVDSKAIHEQLKTCGNEDRLKFEYHKQIAEGKLPLTIGGGIGQSRLCMLMLEKAHIGEVQASIWPKNMIEDSKAGNIILL